MAVPLIGAGVTAGRGLLAYLAKKRAMREVGKQAVMRAGYGAGKTAVHPRTAAMTNLRGRTYPSDAARFVNAPQGRGWGGPITLASLAAGGGYEYGRRHPRDEAMKARRITSDGSRTYLDGTPVTTADQAVAGVYRSAEEAKAAIFDQIANDPYAPMDQRINALLRRETGAAYTEEEARNAMETLRARDVDNLNMNQGGKQILRDDLRNQTGAGYTGGEINTFMGIPDGMKVSKDLGDTAEWNPSESIYPKFMVDQLLEQGVITIDEIFDLGAPDGDSFKIIPKGLGRLDSTRRA